MKKFVDSTTYDHTKVKGSFSDLASKTIPDQSMSIRELVARHTRGLPIYGEKVPIYEGTESSLPPNFEHMDLAEQQEIRENLAKELAQLRTKLQTIDDQRRKAAREQMINDEIEKRQQSLRIRKSDDTASTKGATKSASTPSESD